MRVKNTALFFFVIFYTLILTLPNAANAQIRKGGGGRKASLYFSGGINSATFAPSTVHIDQPRLSNSYDMANVKGDNKIPNASFSPTLLNYRIGYYLGYRQRYGIELNYDPVKYHFTDNQTINEKGTINDVSNISQNILFSSKKGYSYYMKGANLLLANVVRRVTLYRPNSNRIGVDAITKLGVGPAFPSLVCDFPGQNQSGGFKMAGYNAGAEEALRITLYRYIYLEFAAKYDYAWLSNMKVYDGSAKQNLGTTEFVASLGFTFPTRRYNPLFYKGRKIVTILPLFMAKDHPGKAYGKTRKERKKEEKDKLADGPVEDIPEFGDIVERKEKRHMQDSMARQAIEDSVYRAEHPADTAQPQAPPAEEPRKHKRKRHGDDEPPADTTASVPQIPAPETGGLPPVPTPPDGGPQSPSQKDTSAAPARDSSGTNRLGQSAGNTGREGSEAQPQPTADSLADLSPKERKRLEKQARKEKEAQERAAKQQLEAQAQAEQQRQDSIKSAQADQAKEQARANQARQDSISNARELQEQAMKEAAEKHAQDVKDSIAKKKQDAEDEKERKKKELEDLKAQKEKEREELKAKREKELQELKEKREKEKEEREAQRQKEKEEREEKLRKAKEEKDDNSKKDTSGGK